MKRTALILAGAAAFDLGVMAVAAQAQQTGDIPPTRPTHGSPMGGPIFGLSVQDPTGTGGCTPGGPLSNGTANPCGPAALSGEGTRGKHFPVLHIRIDRVNTIQACRARQGEVVMHEGAQQCRIPDPAAAAIGNPTLNPTRRPGGIPPRN
jgi:hypothetical protein